MKLLNHPITAFHIALRLLSCLRIKHIICSIKWQYVINETFLLITAPDVNAIHSLMYVE